MFRSLSVTRSGKAWAAVMVIFGRVAYELALTVGGEQAERRGVSFCCHLLMRSSQRQNLKARTGRLSRLVVDHLGVEMATR